jgi:hypothetical protein
MRPLKLDRLLSEEGSDAVWGEPETSKETRNRRMRRLVSAPRPRLQGGGQIRQQAREIRDEEDARADQIRDRLKARGHRTGDPLPRRI